MREFPIILGKFDRDYVLLNGSEHVSVFAKTRTGKTAGFVVPNCFNYGGSLVVLDIKQQIFRATAGHRAQVLGQDVYLLDPAATDGRTHRWNPLGAIDRTSWDRYDAISRLAYLLFPDAQASGGSGSSNADRFWTPAGRAAYTAITTLIAETPELPLDHETVLRFFARGDGAETVANMIKKRRARGGPQYSRSVVDGVSDYLGGSLEQVEGIRKTVSTSLAAWANPRIASATKVSDFDLRDLRRKPMTIYVAVTPGNIGRMRPFLSLFFEQLVNCNTDKTPEEDASLVTQACVMLDEFSQLGRLETLAQAAQFAAGYGLRFCYVVQNRAQVEARYGKAASLDIFENTGAEAYFGTNDLASTKEVSERFGDNTTIAVTKQRPRFMSAFKWDRHSEAEHLHRRPGMLPQEVARMKRDEQVVFRAGMQPMITKRVPWFLDPALKALEQPPPEIPLIEWSVPEDDGKTRILRKQPRNISGMAETDVETDDVA